MIPFFRTESSHNDKSVGHRRQLWKVLAEAQSGCLRLDLLELASVGVTWFHVKRVSLRRAAAHPKHDAMTTFLFSRCQFVCEGGKPSADTRPTHADGDRPEQFSSRKFVCHRNRSLFESKNNSGIHDQ